MNINLIDVQKWYADKLNKEVAELDSYDLFCAKVAYDYACEQLLIHSVVGQSEQFVCPNGCRQNGDGGSCYACIGK